MAHLAFARFTVLHVIEMLSMISIWVEEPRVGGIFMVFRV